MVEYLKEELEDEFQVGIPDEEAQEITTVQKNVKYLTLHIEPRLEHPPGRERSAESNGCDTRRRVARAVAPR